MAGLATIPTVALVLTTVDWAFSKTSGTGSCLVEGCKFEPKELGEHFNVTVWADRWVHRATASRSHRAAVLAYWQERKDRGLPVNPYAAKKLK